MREITAEDIRKGYDPSKKNSIRKAVQKNDALRYIAASDAAGRFMMAASEFDAAVLSGQKIQSQADLNLFIENASAERKAAVGRELGIEDWNTLNIEGFNEKAAAYRESGKAEAYKQKTAKIEKMKQLADSKPRSIPRAIALADGAVKHYADADSDIAIARTGDTFLVYDFKTGNVTRDMTRAEVNSALAKYRQSKTATTNEADADVKSQIESTSENLSSDEAIDLSDDTELASEISGVTGSAKYKKIQEFVFGILGGRSVKMSDGKIAIVDKSDAAHIAHKAGDEKTARIAKIKELVETAKLYAEDENPTHNGKPHNKFNYFVYYKVDVKYKGETFPIYVNVGRAINDGTYHVYDLTKKIGDNAKRVNVFERPKPNEGYAPKIDVSTNSIPQKGQKVNTESEKSAKTLSEMLPMEEKSRPTVKEIKAANEAKEQAKRFDALAKEKIKDYDGLSEANKSMIRKILREAEANGISEADALSYARVAARTGLDIVFDKKACYKGKNDAGEDVYHAGFYDPDKNRIVVNPETKKKHTVLLIHELSHAMRAYRTKGGEVKYFIDEDAKISATLYDEIEKQYADENGNIDEALILDEASSYYAEAIFGTQGAIDLLLGEKLTLKQKLLSFFKKSAAYYSTDEKLSKEARRHYRKFKAMFDAFTARNYGRNAETGLAGDKKARRYSAELDNSGNGQYNKNKTLSIKEMQNEQGNQDSGILEGQVLSTVSESENNQRQRSNDTANVYSGVARDGDTSRYDTGSNSHRKNVSGYLARTDFVSPYHFKRYQKSILRGLEGKLAERDSSGRRIPQEIREQFKNTILKNEKGELLSVFHWTNTIFDTFEHGDVGFHFGTYDAALDRREGKSFEKGADRVKEVYLNIRKPIFLDDFGYWDCYAIASQLWEKGLISSADLTRLQRTKGYVDGVYNDEASIAIREILDGLGYDGIIYQNASEAKGTLSVAALYPDQIYTVTESKVKTPDSRRFSSETIENVGKSRFDEGEMVELPESASETLKDKLTERNIPYEVYGKSDSARTAKIDKLKGVRFSMNVNIESEIDNALNNKFYRNHVKLTENTPDILLSQKGVRDLPLYMKPSHVRENIFTEQEAISKGYKIGKGINYHGLGKPKFIEVISDLDNVSEAYRGTKNAENPQRREKYFLLISKIKDADGNTINVPIYINEYADYHSVVVETNKVATVFGKEGLRGYLQKEIQKGNIVRIKKKSLQVGDGTAPIAAAFGLKASDNSILNPDAKVNTSDENSSKKSSESGKRYSMEEGIKSVALPTRTAREAGRKLISDGRYKQLIAGFLKAKSYSKKDAMSVINSLPLAFMIKGVSREKMAQSVWQVFNESVADKRMTEGQIKILARDLAEFFASSLMVATIETPNAISAREAISNLKRGIASLEISASERLELQNSVKKADLQRILARWKFKKNNAQGNKNPISIASFIENLAKEVPEMGFSTESNPVQTLIVIDAIYQQSDNKKTKNIA